MEQSDYICPTQPENRMSIHFKHSGTVRHILRLCHIQIPVLHSTAVKPLEYQVEYRALEQSLNITM